MVKFLLDNGAELPHYATELSSGMDVKAFKILKVFRGDREIEAENLKKVQDGFEERGYIKLRSFERILFGTGLKAAIPSNMELQVRSRSGLSLNKGLIVLNSPGTVDADYRGEIGVIITNTTPFLNKVEKGERIAQLVAVTIPRPEISEMSEEEYIDFPYGNSREKNGYGSSGSH